MGPFKSIMAQTGDTYILVVANSCTKWVEAKALHETQPS
jgi:hypothetical protein